MQVAIGDLKSNLSRMLALAQQGEVIEVTSHNKPVARIVGIPSNPTGGLAGSMGQGTISWRGGKPSLAPPLSLADHTSSVSQMVLEDRG